MKKQSLFLVFCLICFPLSSFAEVSQKASEMRKPVSEPPSKGAQKRARDQVEVSKKELLTKLKNNESPEVIGNAKARVQIDRTGSIRQDYLDQEMKNEAKNNKKCTLPPCPEKTENR